jgi:preprotein translocase subunit SecE
MPGITMQLFKRLITFLKEARVEMKKVTWPTREDTIRFTMTVIIISAAVAVFLGGLDFGFQYILNNFIL